MQVAEKKVMTVMLFEIKKFSYAEENSKDVFEQVDAKAAKLTNF